MAVEEGFDFLRDSWSEMVPPENLETDELRSPIFQEIERAVYGNQKLESLFRELKEKILNYSLSADRLSMAKTERDSGRANNEDVKAADNLRKSAHNALIDQVNILSRAFLREGLPNKWRNKVGDTREEIGAWAFGVAEYLLAKAKEESVQ